MNRRSIANATARPRAVLLSKLLPGEEPDPRFTLANERTFLAWIRTSLALMAAGIAVEAFTADLVTEPIRRTVTTLLLVLALLLSAGSALRWVKVERALRQKTPLPVSAIAPLLALGGAVIAALLIPIAASER